MILPFDGVEIMCTFFWHKTQEMSALSAISTKFSRSHTNLHFIASIVSSNVLRMKYFGALKNFLKLNVLGKIKSIEAMNL